MVLKNVAEINIEVNQKRQVARLRIKCSGLAFRPILPIRRDEILVEPKRAGTQIEDLWMRNTNTTSVL